ncbi:hypothetical protein ABMY35_09870 [Pseudoalteromonas sp. BZB3]|uniref:hypothetical protein n=1 Tax=Pseudoalteromonas sp. BZB3 TaxID=3136670 RepID=UPI0032C4147D
MNNFFEATDWLIRGFEVFVVLYLLIKFKDRRWSLFFGGKRDLKTIDDHELHSCFLAAFTVMVFHFASSGFAQYIITMDMERMALRQFFYFSMFCFSIAFGLTLFALHLIRGCSFSPTARFCLYVTFLMMMLQMAQFIIRGMLDSNVLFDVYQYGVVCLNLLTLSIVAKHPVGRLYLFARKKGA